MVDPIPAEMAGRVIPYLMIDGAAEAIDFYRRAFGAVERYRLAMPDGAIGHAEIAVADAPIFLADAPDDMPGDAANPKRLGGTSVLLHLYVRDVDAVVSQAEREGAMVARPPEDQFYGDRAALVVDPWGHHWSLHQHIRDVNPDEMAAAVEQMGSADS